MKQFCFTIDDNIRFIKELSESGAESLFDHPYPALLRRLHERFGIKIQLNLFYRMEGFDLSKASDRFKDEWQANADWLKLSFHSELENVRPYENSGYDEVYNDCRAVHDEILRFFHGGVKDGFFPSLLHGYVLQVGMVVFYQQGTCLGKQAFKKTLLIFGARIVEKKFRLR